MNIKGKVDMKDMLNISVKIAIGSCVAIFIANLLHLEYATSAGIIALLTIVSTKLDTLKLSIYRFISFLIAVLIAFLLFSNISVDWIAYGIFIFLVVFISGIVGWHATISVNAVMGTHFLVNHDFSFQSIINEFLLILIGTVIAVILNLIQNPEGKKQQLLNDMHSVEKELQQILAELSTYLIHQVEKRNVWDDIILLEEQLAVCTEHAYQYQNTILKSHSSYYVLYFEMRTKQCNVLHNLHYEMKKIRNMPKEAKVVAEYISYLKDYVIEKNIPVEQMRRLDDIIDLIKHEELPQNHEEFENRAKLYHILMGLEDFLIYKKRFIESLHDHHFELYWNTSRASIDKEKSK